MSVNVPPLLRYTREINPDPSKSRQEDIQIAVVVVVTPGHGAHQDTPGKPASMSVNVPSSFR